MILAGGAMSTIAVADEAPDAVTVSPDVYKVIAENDSLRVVAATWKPGQRDVMHSHPAIGIYILSDCEKMRVHYADGTSKDWSAKSGTAGANAPVTSHAIENIGDTECRTIFFEPK
jgi:predicted metal-dependent enzyme (double-stranded beta helix superfamily)